MLRGSNQRERLQVSSESPFSLSLSSPDPHACQPSAGSKQAWLFRAQAGWCLITYKGHALRVVLPSGVWAQLKTTLFSCRMNQNQLWAMSVDVAVPFRAMTSQFFENKQAAAAFLHFLVFFVLKRGSHVVKAIQNAFTWWTWLKGCWLGDISKVDVVHREAFWIVPKWNTCRPELWQRHEELCAETRCASWLCREGTLSPSASVWGSAHLEPASSC